VGVCKRNVITYAKAETKTRSKKSSSGVTRCSRSACEPPMLGSDATPAARASAPPIAPRGVRVLSTMLLAYRRYFCRYASSIRASRPASASTNQIVLLLPNVPSDRSDAISSSSAVSIFSSSSAVPPGHRSTSFQIVARFRASARLSAGRARQVAHLESSRRGRPGRAIGGAGGTSSRRLRSPRDDR
jgi:hypothetical protein